MFRGPDLGGWPKVNTDKPTKDNKNEQAEKDLNKKDFFEGERFGQKEINSYFEDLKYSLLPRRMEKMSNSEILADEEGWDLVAGAFANNRFSEDFSTDGEYDYDVDDFGDFKESLIRFLFREQPEKSLHFFGSQLINLYKSRRNEWCKRQIWANHSDYEPSDYSEDEKERNAFLENTTSNAEDKFKKKDLIYDIEENYDNIDEIFSKTTSGIINGIAENVDKLTQGELESYLLNFIDRDYYCQYHIQEIAQCLKKEKNIPADFEVALFNYLWFGPIEKARIIIAVLVEAFGAEEIRKKVAENIESTPTPEEDGSPQEAFIKRQDYLRSLITPFGGKGFIDNLRNFYQNNIRFEDYKVNERMNEKEVALLQDLIGKDEKVLEMGCGTGRLISELAKAGRDISGYDYTERHVQITKKTLEENNLPAKVFQGDWHNNALQNESFDSVYSLGRNILHDYSILSQAQLFKEAARILKPNGQFIFDIPNREKGGYGKMVTEYANEMKKKGIDNFRYGAIYDSPDNKHFATRYAYSQEDIAELAKLSGFEISQVKKEELETGQGDENLYFVLKKKPLKK